LGIQRRKVDGAMYFAGEYDSVNRITAGRMQKMCAAKGPNNISGSSQPPTPKNTGALRPTRENQS